MIEIDDFEKQCEEARRKIEEARKAHDELIEAFRKEETIFVKKAKKKYEGKYFRYLPPHKKHPEFCYIEEVLGIYNFGKDNISYKVKSLWLTCIPDSCHYTVWSVNAFSVSMPKETSFTKITKQEFLDVFDGLLNSASDIRKKME